MDDVRWMKDYPYRMKYRRTDSSWSCDDVRAYRGLGGMAESFADGGKDIAIFAWSR